jgi:hypothetical protein
MCSAGARLPSSLPSSFLSSLPSSLSSLLSWPQVTPLRVLLCSLDNILAQQQQQQQQHHYYHQGPLPYDPSASTPEPPSRHAYRGARDSCGPAGSGSSSSELTGLLAGIAIKSPVHKSHPRAASPALQQQQQQQQQQHNRGSNGSGSGPLPPASPPAPTAPAAAAATAMDLDPGFSRGESPPARLPAPASEPILGSGFGAPGDPQDRSRRKEVAENCGVWYPPVGLAGEQGGHLREYEDGGVKIS